MAEYFDVYADDITENGVANVRKIERLAKGGRHAKIHTPSPSVWRSVGSVYGYTQSGSLASDICAALELLNCDYSLTVADDGSGCFVL